jgi:hypothetical protein
MTMDIYHVAAILRLADSATPEPPAEGHWYSCHSHSHSHRNQPVSYRAD